MYEDVIEIELEEEPIELCKLLKVIDLVEGGGHAKLLIADGYVGVNGETCTQKRKKMYVGDTLHFEQDTFLLTGAEQVVQRQAKPKSTPQPNKPKQDKKAKSKKSQEDAKTGRKPISFG